MTEALDKNFKFNIKKTCCFTGHRPQKVSWEFSEEDERYLKLRSKTKNLIEQAIKSGWTNFITGMALGFDLMCAEIVLDIKKNNPKINLICAVPCSNQTKYWSEEKKIRYNEILNNADIVKQINLEYTLNCMQERNEFMVNNSSMIIALYNNKNFGGTYKTINYAQNKGKQIIILNPEEVY